MNPQAEVRELSSPAVSLNSLPYRDLARIMYELRRMCRRLPLLASSCVHPRHSIHELNQLPASLTTGTNEKTPQPTTPRIAYQWIRCLLSAAYDVLTIFSLHLRFGPLLQRLRQERPAVILKTWCSGLDSLTGPDDFYFGTLPQRLAKRGIRVFLLCGDGRPDGGRLSGKLAQGFFAARLARVMLNQRPVRYVPELMLIPWWAPLAVAWQQVKTSLALRHLSQHTTNHRLVALAAHASLDCLRPFTTKNTYYHYIGKTVVRTWQPRVFVTLYEGHPWEQLLLLGVKTADRTCVTVGYQHTVIMAHAVALTTPDQCSWAAAAIPDVVLCTGEVTKQLMQDGHRDLGSRLIPFGSFRRSSADNPMLPPRPTQRSVLVLPEGILSEALLLFNFAMQLASRFPDYQFVFRCHPILPFSRVRPILARPLEAFRNIEVSDGQPIEQDFTRSSVLLYRGSSAVLYAILHGVKPFYLHDLHADDIDPLFGLSGWRETIASVQEAVTRFRDYAQMDISAITREWQDAAEYVNAYSQPVTEASLTQFLSAVGLHTEGARV